MDGSHRNIFLIRAGALGDTLLTIPAVRALRRHYPHARITAAGRPDYWAPAGDLVDRTISIDDPRLTGLFTPDGRPEAAMFGDIHRAIAWTVRDPTVALRASGIPRVVHASPYPPPGVHAAAWLLRTAGLPKQPIDASLPGVTPAGTDRRVIIHPGAGALWKRWPVERFANLADLLAGRGHPVALLEGPADAEAVQAVRDRARHELPVLRNLSLPLLARHLAGAALYIGNDSGMTHLAAMAGAPVVALFGPTDPVQWAPLGRVAVVRRCARTATRQGEIRVCGDPDCMAAIPLEEVVTAAERLLR